MAMTTDLVLRTTAEEASDLLRIHLDANANVPPTSAVTVAVLQALRRGGNPSSGHGLGEDARKMLAAARDHVAELVEGVFSEDVVFTSGCTEANNTFVASARAASAILITTAVEHPSLMQAASAFQGEGGIVVVLPVNCDGVIDLSALAQQLQELRGPIFISVQTANSETGVLQPVAEIAALIAAHDDVVFHSDAAQAFGKIQLTLGRGRGPDIISVSGHKLHAPMGVGALLLREGETRLSPLLVGGDQEGGRRAGTQSLPLIVGFGTACRDRNTTFADDVAQMRLLRDRLEIGVRTALPTVQVNGGNAPRLPNTSNLRFPGVEAMALVGLLDAEGILASQGSACHSRRPEPSAVLTAMGLSDDDAYSSVRFSVSPLNTEAEIDAAIPIIVGASQQLGVRR